MINNMDELIRDYTNGIFDKAGEMQKEMHILIEVMLKTERGKNMSYDDIKTVYLLYKITEVNEYINKFTGVFNFDGLRKKQNEEELRRKNDDLQKENSISFEDLLKPLKPLNKKWWQIF